MSLVEQQAGMTDLVPCNAGCGGDFEQYSWTQDDHEVVVRVPMPEGATSKQVKVKFQPNQLSIAIGADAPVLDGPLFKTIVVDDATWSVEDKKTVVVTLFKVGGDDWWPHVCTTERQIDMKTLRPPSKHMRDLDDGAQATIQKMMFDQQQKRQGLPTSDELMMERAMAQGGGMPGMPSGMAAASFPPGAPPPPQ